MGHTEDQSSASSSDKLRNLIAACSAITVFGLAFGMTAPLLSLILQQRNIPSEMIGLNSAMMPVGILLFSPLIPVLSMRLGSRNLAIAAALSTGLLIICYKLFDSLSAWFVIRMLPPLFLYGRFMVLKTA